MQHISNYDLISIHYDARKRLTTAIIVCEDTGECFKGRAHHRKGDEFDIKMGSRIAVARAVKKMLMTDVEDDIQCIKDGYCFNFEFDSSVSDDDDEDEEEEE